MRSLLPCLLAACAAAAPTTSRYPAGPRGMRADAHLQAAHDHETRATELARWPQMQQDAGGFDAPGLWYRKWDTTQDERELARYHRGEAVRLQAAYESACANVASHEIGVSPFRRYGLGGLPIANGVVVLLSPAAGPPARLLAAMKCHRAWMMLAEAGMDDCPLDLAGLSVKAYGNELGISVEIRVPDPAMLPELRRRVASDLEH